MKIILDIATILGGMAALLFFWEKLLAFRVSKKFDERVNNNRNIEGQVNRSIPRVTPGQVRISTSTAIPAKEELIRQRIIASLTSDIDPPPTESLWLIYSTPVYCCVGAVSIGLVTIYISPFAGVLTWFIAFVLILVGWRIQDNYGAEDDRAFLLMYGNWLILMASGAGLGTIHDNGLDLSEPTVRTIYMAGEALGCIILGTLAATIRAVRKNRRKSLSSRA